MNDFGISYITKFIYSILTIVLLIFIYTYISSLEEKGCKCAMTSQTAFIKGFTLFAIIYLIFTGFVSDKYFYEIFGSNILILYKYIDLIFIVVFIYYLYVVFQYTRYLVNEKCKCSEDMRREIIMIGSLIEFALIFVLFLLSIITITIFSVLFGVIKGVNEGSGTIHDIINNPVQSLTKVPKKLNDEIKNVRGYVRKTGREIAKIGRKKRG